MRAISLPSPARAKPAPRASPAALTTLAKRPPELPPLPPAVLDPKFRLPTTVVPRRYQPTLTIDPNQESFRGEMRVELKVAAPTRNLILHAHELDVTKATVTIGGETRTPLAIRQVPASKTLVLQFAEPVPQGRAKLDLAWTGKMQEDEMGLSKYGPLASTFFEPVGARRVMPCFDEPAFKCGWQWNLRVPKGMLAATNGAVSHVRDEGATELVRFREVGPFSTYLACLAVGPMASTAPTVVRGVPMRIWTSSHQLQRLELAQKTAAQTVDRLTEYFGTPYPYGKLDFISLPTGVGGMEHVGLITVSDSAVMADASTEPSQQASMTKLIVHEVAHQWFGNLVTMKWWDDLWLNEAFAMWMENKVTDELRPDLKSRERDTPFVQMAFAQDALKTSRPIRREVLTADDAEEAFDAVVYFKGGAVLGMLERALGPEAFRAGLQRYMQAHQGGAASAEDLWHALDGQDLAAATASKIARAWIDQPGHPRVMVERSGDALRLSQERHFSEPGATSEATWPIPVSLRYEDDAGVHTQEVLLEGRQQSVRVAAQGEIRWLCANADRVGFYVTDYDEASRKALVLNLPKLSTLERVALIEDTWGLLKADKARVRELLEVAAACATFDPSATVLNALSEKLLFLDAVVSGTKAQAELRGWVARQFKPALDALGLQPRPGETTEVSERRAALLVLVGAVGRDPKTVEESTSRLSRRLAGEVAALAPELEDAAMRAAGTSGDDALLDQTIAAIRRTDDPVRKQKLVAGLARFQVPEVGRRAIEFALSDEVELGDFFWFVYQSFDHARDRSLLWEHLQANWEKFKGKVGESFLASVVSLMTALPPTSKSQQEVEAFFAAHPIPGIEYSLAQLKEGLRQNVGLAGRIAPDLAGPLP